MGRMARKTRGGDGEQGSKELGAQDRRRLAPAHSARNRVCMRPCGVRERAPGKPVSVVTVESAEGHFALAFVGWDDNIDVDEDRGRQCHYCAQLQLLGPYSEAKGNILQQARPHVEHSRAWKNITAQDRTCTRTVRRLRTASSDGNKNSNYIITTTTGISARFCQARSGPNRGITTASIRSDYIHS